MKVFEKHWEGYTTTLLTGSGAVENSWKPIITAISKIYGFKNLDGDTVNCLFASLVQELRRIIRSNSPGMQQYKKPYLQALEVIRNEISNQIKQSQINNELKPKVEFYEIFEKFLLPDTEVLTCVSTNWDSVIDTALKNLCTKNKPKLFGPIHVHGHFNDPKHLYLPTEITEEPYRSEKEIGEIEFYHLVTQKNMLASDRLVIYGLSLSPLDAELSSAFLVPLNFAKNLKKIIIIDPDHSKVANRLRVNVTKRNDLVVHGYRPDNLNTYTDYSADFGIKVSGEFIKMPT